MPGSQCASRNSRNPPITAPDVDHGAPRNPPIVRSAIVLRLWRQYQSRAAQIPDLDPICANSSCKSPTIDSSSVVNRFTNQVAMRGALTECASVVTKNSEQDRALRPYSGAPVGYGSPP